MEVIEKGEICERTKLGGNNKMGVKTILLRERERERR